MVWNAHEVTEALRFAAEAHLGQTNPGSELPYLLHLAQVLQEAAAATVVDPSLDADLVTLCAALHDTIEDTDVTRDAVERRFGPRVAAGVDALSKREAGPSGAPWSNAEAMADSLQRILAEPREVWVVKLADRVTNLQPPPAHWTAERRHAYRAEAQQIVEALGSASPYLCERMAERLASYPA